MKQATSTLAAVILRMMSLLILLAFLVPLISMAQWIQEGNKLVGLGGPESVYQGCSVSVSSDGNTAIVGGNADNGSTGAAWVYTRSGGVWSQQGNKLVGTGAEGTPNQGISVSISSDGNTAIVGGNFDNGGTGAAWVFIRSGGVWTQQGSKLVGTGSVGTAYQGCSVSLSADGNTAIVGGYYDNSQTGAAWVYTRSGGVWTQQGSKLVGAGAVGKADQGWSVSLSSDGNTAIVGGYYDNSAVGAAWVYTRSGGVWTQQGNKLVGTGAVGNARQGYSVSISSDGNTAMVGGYFDNNWAGAAWVYTRSGGVWTQQGSKLVGTGAVGNANQGCSVSLSSDGNTALVGGYIDNAQTGAAWVFARSGGVWTQQGSKLLGTGAVGNVNQGCSVSLSSDGNTAIVGGYYDNNRAGAVWVYTRAGAVWTQQGSKLVGTGAVGQSYQGGSVSLSADGNTAIVGGSNDNGGVGAVWVYGRSGGAWIQQGNKLVGTGAVGNAGQGGAVSISSDGNTAIVGGCGDNSTAGAVWVFTRSGGVWTQQGGKLVGTGAVGNASQGSAVALSSDGNTALVGGIFDNSNVGAAWVFTRSGGIWTQQGSKLVGSGAVGQAHQGCSVALSADGNTAIVGGYYDNSTVGAAWVFVRSGGVWTQQGNKIVGAGAVGLGGQGYSVSLSSDGNMAIVGGWLDNSGIGAAWVFTRSYGAWTQLGSKLVGTGAVSFAGNPVYQGFSVSLSSDSKTAIIGGYYDNSQAGAAWIFTRLGEVWTQQAGKLVGTGAVGSANQGCSVAISSDGSTAIVGGSDDNGSVGAAWVFRVQAVPRILSVSDIPGDQGGRVRVRWSSSGYDTVSSSAGRQIISYGIWRKIPSGGGGSSLSLQALTKPMNDTLGTLYDFMTSVPAVQSPSYNVAVQTFTDSSSSGVHRCTYLVTAHTYEPQVFYVSAVDSGYSVDNLPPSTPGGGTLSLVAANTVKVSWRPDQTDPDVGYYAVYRSPTSNFTPSPSTLLSTTQDTLYLDTGAGGSTTYYYRVTTVDIHGNQSVPTPEMSLSFTQALSAGWNMIGVPGTVSDGYYRTLYPTATVGTLFGFTGVYAPTDTLHPGAGYWLRFPSATSASTLSIPIQSSTLTLTSGWNMIAGPSCTMLASAINDPGGIIVTGTLYAFNRGYVNSTTLERGKGYWLRTRSAGMVTLTCGSTPRQGEGNPSLADVSSAPTLTISDAVGGQQTLYWNVPLKDPSMKESYSLPPLPAEGCFDARFAGDYRLTGGSEALITIQTDHYPVTITATNIPVGSDAGYVLLEMEGNKEGEVHTLTSGARIEIQNTNVKSVMVKKEGTLPLEFSLEQNYPNPFNPTTLVSWQLPVASDVRLVVYDMLGHEVATLVNETMKPGRYTRAFDARGLASGVYVYRLIAGQYVASRKMLLIK